MDDIDVLGMMFGAGALSAAHDAGIAEKDAEAFVEHVCKEAAAKRVVIADDDDDEDDTWWDRNKGWALPTGIGLGAFLLGANSAMEGRPDRGHWSNLGSYLWNKLRTLSGCSPDPMWQTTDYADPRVLLANEARRRANRLQETRSLSSIDKVDPREEFNPSNPDHVRFMVEGRGMDLGDLSRAYPGRRIGYTTEHKADK